MRVLSAEAMRAVDLRAIEEIGVPGAVLMENAARGLADVVDRLPEVESVAVFCGPGNNGGDGLALARHLETRGYDVVAFLATAGKDLSGDAETQRAVCAALGTELVAFEDDGDLASVLERAAEADLLVDALFGTGLGRPLEGFFARLVTELNALPVPRLAVDLPSGLNGGRFDVFGPCFEADLTVTFAAPKIAHVLPPAADHCGDVVVTDLGVPGWLVEEVEEDERTFLLDAAELALLVPARAAVSHKGDYGHVCVVAGSPGKSGAAILATRAALRGGAGLVTAAVPAPLLDLVDGGSWESMTLALPAGDDGGLAPAAVDQALSFLADKAALALGPGLGQGRPTGQAIRRLAREAPLPLVLDADGLNAFAGRLEELAERPAATVLTPHPGEMGRLLGISGAGISAAAVQADRPAAARRAARESGAVVVLKGHRTLVAEPSGDLHVCLTGNPGMATGGSGDVLTGLLAALAARLDAATAARLAVHLHGLAGDLAVARRGAEALVAGDLLDTLPDAFAELRGELREDGPGAEDSDE